MFTLRPLSDSLSRISGQAFSRKFVTLGRILVHWREIVGPDYALRTRPVGLQRRSAGKGAFQATLEIATDSSTATLLHYQTGVILERLTVVMGEPVVTALRFVHAPANTSSRSTKAPRPLTESEKHGLSSVLSAVDDPELRERLLALGAGVLSRDKQNRNSQR